MKFYGVVVHNPGTIWLHFQWTWPWSVDVKKS